MLRSSWILRSRLITPACTLTSSADTGSSSTMKLGVESQRTGDADPLTLATRELVRVAVAVLGPQTDVLEELRDLLETLGRAEVLVDDERFCDDVVHRHLRVERRVRVLEDHLDLLAETLELASIETDQFPTVVLHRTGRGFVQLQHRSPGRLLAGARLADQPERLARPRRRTTDPRRRGPCRPGAGSGPRC